MNILQVSPYSRLFAGGSQNFCYELSKQLFQRNHDITIWTSRYPRTLSKVDTTYGFPIKRLFMLHNVWQLNPTTMLPTVLGEIDKYDIVHAHSYIFFSTNQLAFYRKLKRFPFVLHLHGGLGDLNASLVGKKKFVTKRLYDKTIGKATIKTADAIISVSKSDADFVIEHYNVAKDKICVIPNAVDVKRFTKSNAESVATYVGRLTLWKGSKQMPKIFNQLVDKGVSVNVVGYGPELDYLKKNCGEQVNFFGFVPNQKIPEVLMNTEVLMLPSFMEGLPTVCLEAMASGVPSVAYDVGGVKECVRNGITGYVVKKGDVNGFVDKTLRIIEDNGFRDKCLEIARAEYDWRVVTNKIENVYQKLCEQYE